MFRLSAVREALSVIRLEPFDVSTPEGRSKERLRRASLTALSAGLSRAVALATPLVTIRVSLGYLGAERYGLWTTVGSLIGMLGFSDLGLGNGLVTCICRARGSEDMALIRRAVSSTLVVLLAVMGLLFACAAIAWPLTPWARVLNATAAASPRDAGIAVAVCLLTFLIGLPLGIIQRVQAGFQEEYLSQLWQGGASLAGMTMVLLLAHFHASFPVFLLLVGLAGPLVMLLNGLAYFGWQRPSVRPRFQEWDRGTARLMLRQGRWFLAVTMITLVAAQVDNLVIAQVQGLASVPTYSIPSKVFTILATVGMMIYQPMWAANGEALARGELQWVRRNTRRVSALGGMLMLAAGAGFIVLARPVFRIWLGPAFEPSFLLMTGMALWTTLLCFIGPYFMVLNGANVIQPQVYRFCAFAIVSIPLKYAAARLLGAWAIPWAAVIPYAAIIVPFALRQSRKILSDEWRGSAQARAARHA